MQLTITINKRTIAIAITATILAATIFFAGYSMNGKGRYQAFGPQNNKMILDTRTGVVSPAALHDPDSYKSIFEWDVLKDIDVVVVQWVGLAMFAIIIIYFCTTRFIRRLTA